MWADTTTYRQGEVRGEASPRQWQISAGSLVVTIHRHIYHSGWRLTCAAVGISNSGLDAQELAEHESAKKQAIQRVIAAALATSLDARKLVVADATIVDHAIATAMTLTYADREEFIAKLSAMVCLRCGFDQPRTGRRCQCWNDE